MGRFYSLYQPFSFDLMCFDTFHFYLCQVLSCQDDNIYYLLLTYRTIFQILLGDIVGVLLDMDEGTISFFKDGEDFNLSRIVVVNMGVAYHNLRRNNRSPSSVLYPCFGIKTAGDQLSLRASKWVSVKGLGPSALLKHVLEAKQILSEWRDSYLSSTTYSSSLSIMSDNAADIMNCESNDSTTISSPPSFSSSPSSFSSTSMKKIYSAYLLWRAHDKVKVRTRPGLEVSVDTRIEAIQAASGPLALKSNIHAGMKIATKYGDGSITGVLGSRIWFTLNNSETGE